MMTQPDSCNPDSVAESVLGSEETSSGENLNCSSLERDTVNISFITSTTTMGAKQERYAL